VLERINPVLRILCIALAGLFLYQASRVAFRRDPLSDLNVSSLGLALSPAPEAKPSGTNSAPRSNLGAGAMARKPMELPAPIQARVDRIVESEILGPIVRPLPMALLGIAGEHAFLRAPSGQTGLLKEGEQLGAIKLVRIGANRVLVEEDGQTKELTIFSGFGSESLLPKGESH
jgi:hypothetical protein